MNSSDIETGKTYDVEYPFHWTTVSLPDEDGYHERGTWAPGTASEQVAPDDAIAIAHGVGQMLLRVVSVHDLPKPYHPRIFFVRQWVDPDGKQFGKTNLRIMGIQAFRRRLRGYMVDHYGSEYEMRPLPTQD